MKPRVLLLILVATVTAVAQHRRATNPASTVAVPKIVPVIRNPFGPAPTAAEIRDIRRQSVDRAPASQTDTPPADSDVLELPKMTVKQQPKPRPRLGDHTILGPKAMNDELARKMTTGLDRG